MTYFYGFILTNLRPFGPRCMLADPDEENGIEVDEKDVSLVETLPDEVNLSHSAVMLTLDVIEALVYLFLHVIETASSATFHVPKTLREVLQELGRLGALDFAVLHWCTACV